MRIIPVVILLSGCQTVWTSAPEQNQILFPELDECTTVAQKNKLKAGQFGKDIRSVTYRAVLPSGEYCRGETQENGEFWYSQNTKVGFYLGAYQVGETWGQRHITPAIFEMQPLVHFNNLPTKGNEELLSYRTRRLYSALFDSMKEGHLAGQFQIDKAREWSVAEHYFGKGQSAYYDPGYQSIFSLIGINDLAPRAGKYEGQIRDSGWHPQGLDCPAYKIRFSLTHDAQGDVGRLSLEDIEMFGKNNRWEAADGFYKKPDVGAIFPFYSFSEIRSDALENPISMSMSFSQEGHFIGSYKDPKGFCQGDFVLTKLQGSD